MTMDVGRKPRVKERDVKKQFDGDKRIKPKNEESKTEFLYGELGGKLLGLCVSIVATYLSSVFFFFMLPL